jgi:alginate O-acetyltransferase complex protein AlgJ
MRSATNAVLVGIFAFLLWLPTFDSFLHLDKAPTPNEKRAPAKFPAFAATFDGLRTFLAGLEAYYSDHFGFRKRLIRWEHRWKRDLFKESTLSDVMIGRDGFLFYAGDNMIEDFRGTKPFEIAQLQAWQSLLEGRRNWCARHGIKYMFVLTPDKHSVYPEFLPDWMTRVGKETRADQFINWMKAHSNVEVLDLRPPLIEAKKIQRTYLFTDTHWNFFGGFIGYQNVIETLSKQMPELKPLSLDQFEQKTTEQPGGDLAGMLGEEQTLREKNYFGLEPKPPLEALKTVTETNFLNKKWGNLAEPRITTNPRAQGKAILFHDSFALGWVPFLGYHFHQVVYIWKYNWEKTFVEREKPDVVIDEMLERFLVHENPTALKEKDEHPESTVASYK